MVAIGLFFVVYIILIILSVILSIGCVFLGVSVIAGLSNIIGIIAGLGIISIGILVFVFLVKFIFSVKKYDESNSIEITEAEQPQLFGFIRQLTTDTHTKFPKKIVLSPDVNASVFYNDSFWSMIFPVKKNLQIGLGLVNTLTLSEFKAVMAHEFGHFSQRSMKLGSFVYNVNKAIYNMLFENKDYGKFLSGWGSVHWVISIFVWLTIQIIKGIQSILQGMYSFINKQYMRLSREMEFHADAVAASVSGSNNCIAALNKLEISTACYNTVLQKADDFLGEKKVLQNIYQKHSIVMQQFGDQYNLPTVLHVPVVDDSFKKRFQQSRVNIKDQWASHPSNEDRTQKLEEIALNAGTDNRSAWVLFNDAEKVQQQLSAVLYKNVSAEIKQETLNADEFKEKYLLDIESFHLPEEYKGFYEQHIMQEADIEQLISQSQNTEISKETFDKLFNDETTSLAKAVISNRTDEQTINAIASKQIDTKSFDFDGKKYKSSEAEDVLKLLKAEIEKQTSLLKQHDENAFVFFYKVALLKSEDDASSLKNSYNAYFSNRAKTDKYIGVCNRVIELLSPLLMGQTVSIEAANQMAAGLRDESQEIRLYLKAWIEQGVFDDAALIKNRAIHFVNVNYQYFVNESFFDAELTELHQLIINTVPHLQSYQFKDFKKILVKQLELYKSVFA